jgi:hypothetical protein
MKLKLSRAIQSKIQYFNSRFPSKEWSGPAWYSLKADKNGFPVEFALSHFHPLDLGHGTATEWEAKDLAKVLKTTYDSYPKLKKCFLGLIHSHHTMGAFFSGTDASTLRDMAPDVGFYCSLVVATAKDPFAFAFAYKDQYGQSQMIEIDEDDITGTPVKAEQPWIDVADTIEKANKPVVYAGTNGQLGFYQGGNYRPGYGYGNTYASNDKKANYDDKQTKEMEALAKELSDNQISWYEFKVKSEELNCDPLEYWDERPDTPFYSKSYGGYNY